VTSINPSAYEWPFQYAVVPIGDCIIDHSYQRDSKTEWITKKKECFDPLLILTLIGSRRANGKIALVDGQQRWLLLKELGFDVAPMLILNGLTPAGEARLFAELNFEKSLIRAFFHYRAMLFAKDPEIVKINNVVENANFVIGRALMTENVIAAAGAIVKIYRKDTDVVAAGSLIEGNELLAKTLDVLNIAWRNRTVDWKDAKTSGMLHGVSRWLSVNELVPVDDLASVLEGILPSIVLQEAAGIHAQGSGSGKGRKVETVIERRYRKKFPKFVTTARAAA
jgi:hypothetical protein